MELKFGIELFINSPCCAVHCQQKPEASPEIQRQKRRTDEILTEFSQICVSAILNRQGFSLEDVKSVMRAMGYQHVTDFLTRCFSGTQVIQLSA